jgi:hypothetical protein
MLTGDSAEDLGIRVLYNMPTPTVLHFWRGNKNVLTKLDSTGWKGGSPSNKFQKVMHLQRVKAECGYSASDYFSTVFELIASRADVNYEDLSGTELEEAETALFRASIAENIRATMWYGDTSNSSGFNTFNGFLKQICDRMDNDIVSIGYVKGLGNGEWAENLLKKMWERSNDKLRNLRSEDNLVFFVTSDVYNAYESSLDNVALEAAYLARQNGREKLFYRGIPVVDVRLSEYAGMAGNLPKSFAILTDRRNLALAVNTNEFPGSEVRMWYNPDEMENRQRAVFTAGCDYLLPELITIAVEAPVAMADVSHDGTNMKLNIKWGNTNNVEYAYVCGYDAAGELECDCEEIDFESSGTTAYEYPMPSLGYATLTIGYTNGMYIQVYL